MQAIFTYFLLGATLFLNASAQYTGQSDPPNRAASKPIEFQAVPQGQNKVWFGDKIEGAAVDKQGNIYAVDMCASSNSPDRKLNTIGRLDVDGKSNVFYTDPEPNTYINGVRFAQPRSGAKGGRALLADVNNHRVIELTWTDSKTPEALQGGDNANYNRTILCQDATMLQPNDLAVAPNGKHVYLSGMKGETNTGSGDVWLCDEKGAAQRIGLMGRTNGIEVDPKGEYLYVSEAVGGWTPTASYIWRYKLNPDTGMPVGDKEKFFDFQEYDKSGSTDCDGMRFDKNGFLYVTRNGRGEVVKISPGKTGETFKLPFQSVTNLEFGGSNGKTLYTVGSCPGSKPEEKTGCVAKADAEVMGRAVNELRRESPKVKSTDKPTTAAKNDYGTPVH